jgi:two-component system sensor histidine kinase EvgS
MNIRWLVALILISGPQQHSSAGGVLAGTQQDAFTSEQRAWIVAHPRPVVGAYANGLPPFSSFQSGQLQGLSYEYLSEAARAAGMQLQVQKFDSWADLVEAACEGKVDIIMHVSITSERTRCLAFTRPYVEAPLAIVFRTDRAKDFDNRSLKGRRLLTIKGDAAQAAVRRRYASARHIEATSTTLALQAIARGDADAYVGNAYVAVAAIGAGEFGGRLSISPADVPADLLHFGVPNENRVLAEIIDAALATVPDSKKNAIRQRLLPVLPWRARTSIGDDPQFSPAELAALAAPTRVGVLIDASPLSVINGAGEPEGLTSEYLHRFRTLGANLHIIPVTDWLMLTRMMSAGDLDVVVGVPNDLGAMGADWTYGAPFISIPNVIVTRDEGNRVLAIQDLDGRRVVVSDSGRLGAAISRLAPRATIIAAPSTSEALSILHAGDADAFVGNLAIAGNVVWSRYAGDLKVSAPAGVDDQLALAARGPFAPLITAFDTMVRGMPARDHAAIRNDWLTAEEQDEFSVVEALKIAWPVLLMLIGAAVAHGVGHIRLRREVEDRRQAENRLSNVTRNLPAVVYQAEIRRGGSFAFPFIAGDMQSLFGISISSAMEDQGSLLACIYEEDLPLVERALSSAPTASEPIDIEFRVHNDDGVRWVRSHGAPHCRGDRVLWNGYWIDVTQAHEQQRALTEAKQEAEQAANAKAEFLATMSHEIRTPMSGILGMLDIIQSIEVNPNKLEMLEIINESAKALRQVLDDVLDLSRIDAGAVIIESYPLSLHKLVSSVVTLFGADAQAAGSTLHTNISPDIEALHWIDATRLRQVLQNLLSNAIKFGEGGVIDVEVWVQDKLGDSDPAIQNICFSVIDHGIGIPEDQIQSILQPFAQADPSISRQYGGTGLGLSICGRLTSLMGGEMSLRSTLAEGTRVDVCLPLVVVLEDDPASPHVEGPIVEAKFADGLRVLVVEDHSTNRMVLKWLLDQIGVDSDLVEDGLTAIAMLRDQSFHAVLTDLHMPGMDGFQLVRAIRSQEMEEGRPPMPIFAITADTASGTMKKCLASGMAGCLVKPVSRRHLADALRLCIPEVPSEPMMIEGRPAHLPAIDGSINELMMTYGSLETVRQLVASLEDNLAVDLERIVDALGPGQDVTIAQQGLHRIAGSVGLVGNHALAELADELSSLLKDGRAEIVRDQLGRFEETALPCLTRLRELRIDLSSGLKQ